MQSVGIRELRASLSGIMRRVAGGEAVEVTDRGRVVARIVPVRHRSTLDQLISEGRASSAEGDLLRHEPPPRQPGERSLSEALAELRADER